MSEVEVKHTLKGRIVTIYPTGMQLVQTESKLPGAKYLNFMGDNRIVDGHEGSEVVVWYEVTLAIIEGRKQAIAGVWRGRVK